MRKPVAILGSLLFLVVAPGSIVGLLPWWITRWQMQAPFFGQAWLRWLGVALIALGLVPLVNSFVRFALEGLGTPAPVAPPTKLVVTGFYRHVRNPMYVGVVAILLGEALLFGDAQLVALAAIVWLFAHVFVLAYEEPTLRQTFGAEYETYCVNVPRWIPRITAWRR